MEGWHLLRGAEKKALKKAVVRGGLPVETVEPGVGRPSPHRPSKSGRLDFARDDSGWEF